MKYGYAKQNNKQIIYKRENNDSITNKWSRKTIKNSASTRPKINTLIFYNKQVLKKNEILKIWFDII